MIHSNLTIIPDVHQSSIPQENVDTVDVILRHSQMQGRLTLAVDNVWISSLPQEESQDIP